MAGTLTGVAFAVVGAAVVMSVKVARSVITPPQVRMNDVYIL